MVETRAEQAASLVKQPRQAFDFYYVAKRPAARSKQPYLSADDLKKVVRVQWKHEPDEVRKEFFKQQEEDEGEEDDGGAYFSPGSIPVRGNALAALAGAIAVTPGRSAHSSRAVSTSEAFRAGALTRKAITHA